MTRLSGSIVLSLALISPLLVAQTRNDFARGFTVEPEGEGPLWELRLPEDVYRTVTRPDLGDLRVFNRDAVIVPHTVRDAAPLQVEAPEAQSLALFPLRGLAEEGVRGQSLRITTDAQGAIISAISEGAAADGANGVAAYLVDVSALEEMPNRLELDWESRAAGGFAATIDVESSDDLSTWQTVVSGVTLADLRSGDAVLVHRDIDVPPLEARYLRLEWPDALQEVQLTGIRAFFRAREQPPTHETTLITGDLSSDTPTAYEFDTGGFRPVDQVRVVFQERNAVLDAVLLSRRAPDQDWTRRHAATFYSLERDGTQVQSAPINFEATSDRYWRMEIEGRQDRAGSPPSLEIGWIPGLLTVVAQGESPFTVAFGSVTVEANDRAATDGLLSVINDERGQGLISPARASEVFTLGGESRLAPPVPPLPWRTWALWVVLVTGVALLGWMVRQLARQMGTS